MSWDTIERDAGKLSLAGKELVAREFLDIELVDGNVVSGEWYEDPHGRPGVFLAVRLSNGNAFKSLVYLPEGIKARRRK